MEGTLCAHPQCRVHDYLPFRCPRCEGVFCLEHRSRFSHPCHHHSKAEDADHTLVSPADLSHLPSAKAMLAAVETRFDHKADASASKPREHWQVQHTEEKAPMATTGSHLAKQLDRLDHLQKNRTDATVQQRAEKTRKMLLKQRATGDANIALEDRLYLALHFVDELSEAISTDEARLFPTLAPDSNRLQYIYFNRHLSLGDCLHRIKQTYFASLLQRLIFSVAHPRSEHFALVAYTVDASDWLSWDRSASLETVLSSGEDIYVGPVAVDLVLNQASSAAASSSSSSAAPIKRKTYTPAPAIVKGGLAWYHKHNNAHSETPAEGPPLSLEEAQDRNILCTLVRVVGVHLDDFPNIYYTIAPHQPLTYSQSAASAEDTQRLRFHDEKQTDNAHLFACTESKPASASTASSSSTFSATSEKRRALEEEIQAIQDAYRSGSSAVAAGPGFHVTLSFAGKDFPQVYLAANCLVRDLRYLATLYLQHYQLGTDQGSHDTKKREVRLLAKGVLLKQDAARLKDIGAGKLAKVVILG